MSIDTACSSSLVATSTAMRGLGNKEQSFSLCLGVQAILTPKLQRLLSSTGMLSPDGRCKTFDARANGFVRGEGCGGVLLVRESDFSHQRAVASHCILSHAVNQDGRSNGLTAPNGPSQSRLIQTALTKANLNKTRVSYLEAHGTGTSLGDPIEMQAVANALGRQSTMASPIVVGSVKTNFGHTETAAGMLGILRILVNMEHNQVTPHLHFETLNEYIGVDLMEGHRCSIPIEAIEWKMDDKIAGVSSFGFSGTNSHALVGTLDGQEEVGDVVGALATIVTTRAPSMARLNFQLCHLEENLATIGLVKVGNRHLALPYEARVVLDPRKHQVMRFDFAQTTQQQQSSMVFYASGPGWKCGNNSLRHTLMLDWQMMEPMGAVALCKNNRVTMAGAFWCEVAVTRQLLEWEVPIEFDGDRVGYKLARRQTSVFDGIWKSFREMEKLASDGSKATGRTRVCWRQSQKSIQVIGSRSLSFLRRFRICHSSMFTAIFCRQNFSLTSFAEQ